MKNQIAGSETLRAWRESAPYWKFRFAESGKLAGVLRGAGATDVRERVLQFHIEAPISPSEYWELRSETSDTLREKLAKLSAPELRCVKQEVEEAVRGYFPNDQMSFPAQAVVVSGMKPG